MISLIDVANYIDEKNMPVGHGLKLLKEMPKLFGEKTEILAGKEYIHELKNDGKVLPCRIHSGIIKKRNIRILYNYFISLFLAKGDVLIYSFVLEPLLWGIAFTKLKRKIVIVTCWDWDNYIKSDLFNKPIRKYLVERGLKHIDGCIVTNYLYVPTKPYLRLSDYYVTDEIKKYCKHEKRNGCICLGEVRSSKDVLGLVRVISKTNISLLVVGSFQDKKMYRRVKKFQSDRIKIDNENLSYDAYLEYLSLYKYVVLPYDIKTYDGRTSGVLLEGIFLGAIPIAPKRLLEQNRIQGLGYHKISDIPKLIDLYESGNITIENDLKKYQFENCKREMRQFLNSLNNK